MIFLRERVLAFVALSGLDEADFRAGLFDGGDLFDGGRMFDGGVGTQVLVF